MTDTLEVPPASSSNQALRPGVLGLFDSVIMGAAGVTPGYSIAASTAVLFGAVLLGGAAALLYCGIAMFGIVFAFSYLGRVEANAGASYSWVRRALHPVLGYLSGWALIVSALIFMAYLFVKAIPTLNDASRWVGLGAMAPGLTPMSYYWAKKNPYFKMAAKEDRVAVLEEFEQNL